MASKLLQNQMANANPGARILALEKRIGIIEQYLTDESEAGKTPEPDAATAAGVAPEPDAVVLKEPKKRGRPPKQKIDEVEHASAPDPSEV